MEALNYQLVSATMFKALFPKHENGGETVAIMEPCQKYNRHGQTQDRILIVSDQAFYLVSARKVHSKFMISDLVFIIKALESKEFILHVANPKEKVDIRLSAERRDEVEGIFKMRFINL